MATITTSSYNIYNGANVTVPIKRAVQRIKFRFTLLCETIPLVDGKTARGLAYLAVQGVSQSFVEKFLIVTEAGFMDIEYYLSGQSVDFIVARAVEGINEAEGVGLEIEVEEYNK